MSTTDTDATPSMEGLLLPVSTRVRVVYDAEDTPYSGRVGTVSRLDFNDPILPYNVELDEDDQHAADYGWFRPDQVVALDADEPIDQMNLGVAIRELHTAFVTGTRALGEMQKLAMRVRQLWAARQPTEAATGLCSACMTQVIFDAAAGRWGHVDGNDSCRTPAVLLGVLGDDQ